MRTPGERSHSQLAHAVVETGDEHEMTCRRRVSMLPSICNLIAALHSAPALLRLEQSCCVDLAIRIREIFMCPTLDASISRAGARFQVPQPWTRGWIWRSPLRIEIL